MAKKSELPTEEAVVDLMEVFTRGEDGRLYCVTCAYDTQLVNKARNHAVAVHRANLRPVQTVVKVRGVVPPTLETEIVFQDVPASAPGIPDEVGKGV